MTNKTITISWTPDLHRTNGAAANASELDSVKVYSDQGAGGSFFQQAVIPAVSGSQCVISNVPPGTYKYKLAEIDSNGLEGPQGPVITAVIDAPPAPLNPPSNGQATVS